MAKKKAPSEVDTLRATVEKLEEELKDALHSCKVTRELCLKAEHDRDTYKKAKEENDDRFAQETADAISRAEEFRMEMNTQTEMKKQERQEKLNAIALAEGDRKRFEAEKVAFISQAEALNEEIAASAARVYELKAELEVMTARWNSSSAAAQKLADEAIYWQRKHKEASESTVSGVLLEVHRERERQDAKWGIQNHPDGTCMGSQGAKVAREHADAAKSICRHFAKLKQLTWAHVLNEEMMEAYAETEPASLRTELIQVAAVACAWVECIDRRTGERARTE